jgi:hypothetical protein
MQYASASKSQNVQVCYRFGGDGTKPPLRFTAVTVKGKVTYYSGGVRVTDPTTIAWMDQIVAQATSDMIEDCSQEEIESLDTELKAYTDAGDATTLAGAKAYADTQDATTLTGAKAYADAGDATTLAGAKAYADTQDATTLAGAKAYTDAAIPKVFAKIVYTNDVDPNASAVFDTSYPPVAHDDALRANDDYLYIGEDASAWVFRSGGYEKLNAGGATAWNLNIEGVETDAGGNKTDTIVRSGGIVTGNILSLGAADNEFGGSLAAVTKGADPNTGVYSCVKLMATEDSTWIALSVQRTPDIRIGVGITVADPETGVPVKASNYVVVHQNNHMDGGVIFTGYLDQPIIAIDNATASVGIGTTKPEFKVDVAGTARISDLPDTSLATHMVVVDPITQQLKSQRIPTGGGAVYAKIVHVDAYDPNEGTTFSTDYPPRENDETLKANDDNLYVGQDASTWVYRDGRYEPIRADSRGMRTVATLPSGTTLQPVLRSADVFWQECTLSAGQTLTINVPLGAPNDEERFEIRLRSQAAVNLGFVGLSYQGSTDLSLPVTTSGANKIDRMGFSYCAITGKWHLTAKVFGF